MSKKKDPNSWKGRGEAYKNARRSPVEDAPMPHVKKKKKEKKWDKHKHEYIPAIYYQNWIGLNGEPHLAIKCGSHCKICGRVNGMMYMYSNREDRIERFKEENPNFIEVTLPDSWSYFKDSCVPLSELV